MDVIEWLDDQIAKSLLHPEIKRSYLWVVNNFTLYEAGNGKAKKELDSRIDKETGSIAQTVECARGESDPVPKVKRGRPKKREVRAKGKVSKDPEKDKK